jgi:hypothetical protein
MTSTEKKWVLGLSIALLTVTTLPILAGFWLQGNAWRFTGFFMGVEDGNSYIAKMMLGTAGEWLFRTPYTAFPQNGFMAFFPYILLGKLASYPGAHEQLVALFQIFRWAGGWVMVYGEYQFFAFFFDDQNTRKFCTILATVGGGAGWLALIGLQGIWGNRIPIEFYSPETFGFLSFFTLPHLAAGRGLLLLGLVRYWRSYTSAFTLKSSTISGVLWLILGLMQPLTALIGWGIIGIDLIIRIARSQWTHSWTWLKSWKELLINLVLLAVFSMPLILYSSVSFLTDPFLKEWSVQNIILSPPPIDYLMAYLFLIPLLGLGGWIVIRGKEEKFFPLLGWILFVPILAYLPVNLQRRLPEGSWAALSAVGTVGIGYLKPKWQPVVRAVLYSTILSTLVLFLGSFLTLSQVKPPVYRPAEEIQAFDFLRQRAKDFPVVLAGFETSNALPAWAPVRTIIGHGPESIHMTQVMPAVEGFYQADLKQDERTKFLREFNIRYVIWGPGERKLGDLNPEEITGLKLIFQNTTYQVFEVVD